MQNDVIFVDTHLPVRPSPAHLSAYNCYSRYCTVLVSKKTTDAGLRRVTMGTATNGTQVSIFTPDPKHQLKIVQVALVPSMSLLRKEFSFTGTQAGTHLW